MTLTDQTDANLLAAIDASDPVPPEVLDAARAVYVAAAAVERRERSNPFAPIAEPDEDDYALAETRVHERFQAICGAYGGLLIQEPTMWRPTGGAA